MLGKAVSGALRLWTVMGVLALIRAIIPACVRFPNGLGLIHRPLVLWGVRLFGFGVLWFVGGVETVGFGVRGLSSVLSGRGGEVLFASGLVGLLGDGSSSVLSLLSEGSSPSDGVFEEIEGSVSSWVVDKKDSLGTQVLSLQLS